MLTGQCWTQEHKDALIGAVTAMVEQVMKFKDDYIGCTVLLDKQEDSGKHVLSVRFERGDRSAAFAVDDSLQAYAVTSLMEAMGSALESMDIDLGDDDADGKE